MLRGNLDLKLIGTLIGMLVIVSLLFSLMAPADAFMANAETRQTKAVEDIIDKAMVQCYALEGSYPPNLAYLESYGIIMDEGHYNYYFEPIGSNIKPTVKVFQK
jgi:competence protein ComGC